MGACQLLPYKLFKSGDEKLERKTAICFNLVLILVTTWRGVLLKDPRQLVVKGR